MIWGRGMRIGVAALLAAAAAGCDDGGEPAIESVVPPDFETRWVELRDCRQSIEHELEYVRLLADADTAAMYARCVVESSPCSEPFATGATLVKPHYRDAQCTELTGYTAARREAPGESDDASGWRWQVLDADGHVERDGELADCVSCHTTLCGPGAGYDLRCVMDP